MKKVLLITLLTFSLITNAQNRIAAWSSFNPSTETYPKAANSINGNVTAANLNFSNFVLQDDSRTVITPNVEANFNVLSSPYIEFNLTLNGVVDFDRFVLAGFAVPFPVPNTIVSLRWSVDNYSSNLGNFTRNTSGYALTSVDLNNLSSFGPGNISFRIYFYGASSSSADYFFVSGTNYTTPDGTPSNYNSPSNSSAFQIFGNAVLSSTTFEDNTKIKIYPNPSNGIYTIESDTNTRIEVYDLIGKQIQTQVCTVGSSTLNLSDFNSGIYLAKVTNENNQTKTIKLVKE